MPKALDPAIVEILQRYGEDGRTAAWDCHGVWVVYHKAVERIAAKAGVTFEMPEIVEGKASEKIVTILVRGFLGDKSEWSFGEASPANNKNAYVYAMAEKRAKDRVVLKLVGLHGLAYSEEESDDFRENAAPPAKADKPKTSSAELKRNDEWTQFETDLYACTTVAQINGLYKAVQPRWTASWLEQAVEACGKHKAHILAQEISDDDTFPGDRPSGYDKSRNLHMAG